jgi:hypothetical protein
MKGIQNQMKNELEIKLISAPIQNSAINLSNETFENLMNSPANLIGEIEENMHLKDSNQNVVRHWSAKMNKYLNPRTGEQIKGQNDYCKEQTRWNKGLYETIKDASIHLIESVPPALDYCDASLKTNKKIVEILTSIEEFEPSNISIINLIGTLQSKGCYYELYIDDFMTEDEIIISNKFGGAKVIVRDVVKDSTLQELYECNNDYEIPTTKPLNDYPEFREVSSLFQRLWTKATHLEGYNKEEWKQLQKYIEDYQVTVRDNNSFLAVQEKVASKNTKTYDEKTIGVDTHLYLIDEFNEFFKEASEESRAHGVTNNSFYDSTKFLWMRWVSAPVYDTLLQNLKKEQMIRENNQCFCCWKEIPKGEHRIRYEYKSISSTEDCYVCFECHDKLQQMPHGKNDVTNSVIEIRREKYNNGINEFYNENTIIPNQSTYGHDYDLRIQNVPSNKYGPALLVDKKNVSFVGPEEYVIPISNYRNIEFTFDINSSQMQEISVDFYASNDSENKNWIKVNSEFDEKFSHINGNCCFTKEVLCGTSIQGKVRFSNLMSEYIKIALSTPCQGSYKNIVPTDNIKISCVMDNHHYVEEEADVKYFDGKVDLLTDYGKTLIENLENQPTIISSGIAQICLKKDISECVATVAPKNVSIKVDIAELNIGNMVTRSPGKSQVTIKNCICNDMNKYFAVNNLGLENSIGIGTGLNLFLHVRDVWYELTGCYIVSATSDYESGKEVYKFDMIANKLEETNCLQNIMKETLDHASDPSWSPQIFPGTKKPEEKERWQDSWYDRYDKYEQKIS